MKLPLGFHDSATVFVCAPEFSSYVFVVCHGALKPKRYWGPFQSLETDPRNRLENHSTYESSKKETRQPGSRKFFNVSPPREAHEGR